MEWQVSKVLRRATGKRILVVEDEEHVRVLLHHVLASSGYTVDSVATAAAALQKLEARHYHLILTDDRLPDGRGVAIADKAAERGIDAVVITGYGLQLAKDEAARHEFLMKPVTPQELVSAIDRHFSLDGQSPSPLAPV
jgi:two-component system, NtrC family, C4-dicarboxylate transport response regulator DctD